MSGVFAKVSGTYQKASNVHAKVGGTWKKSNGVYSRVSGIWQKSSVGGPFNNSLGSFVVRVEKMEQEQNVFTTGYVSSEASDQPFGDLMDVDIIPGNIVLGIYSYYKKDTNGVIIPVYNYLYILPITSDMELIKKISINDIIYNVYYGEPNAYLLGEHDTSTSPPIADEAIFDQYAGQDIQCYIGYD